MPGTVLSIGGEDGEEGGQALSSWALQSSKGTQNKNKDSNTDIEAKRIPLRLRHTQECYREKVQLQSKASHS